MSSSSIVDFAAAIDQQEVGFAALFFSLVQSASVPLLMPMILLLLLIGPLLLLSGSDANGWINQSIRGAKTIIAYIDPSTLVAVAASVAAD